MNIYKDGAYVYEVETTYKSMRVRTDLISADSEKEMWEIYDKHHDANKVKSSVIVDTWLQ